MQNKICEQCSKNFQRYHDGRFCSFQCYWDSMRVCKKFVCETCKIEFVPKSHGKKYKYCSIKCRNNNINWKKLNSESHKGKLAWNRGKPNIWSNGEKSNFWKGGVSETSRSERSNLMSSLDYCNWRKHIFNKDDYTCQICMKTNTLLQAHHILPYSDFPEYSLEKDNGITLCKTCHNSTKGKEWKFIPKFMNI